MFAIIISAKDVALHILNLSNRFESLLRDIRNDRTTEMCVLDERDCMKFEFKDEFPLYCYIPSLSSTQASFVFAKRNELILF